MVKICPPSFRRQLTRCGWFEFYLKYQKENDHLSVIVSFWRLKQGSNLWQLRSETLSHERLGAASIALCFFLFSACCICHRQRKPANQLTATVITNVVSEVRELSRWQKKIKGYSNEYPLILAPQTGLEPVTPRLTAACSASWAIEALNKKMSASPYLPGRLPAKYFQHWRA